jgi:hypothetical protein
MFNKWREKRQQKNKLKIFNLRTQELDKAMYKLYAEHKVLSSLEEIYTLIHNYAEIKEKWEEKYCYDFLVRWYSETYNRYDNESFK